MVRFALLFYSVIFPLLFVLYIPFYLVKLRKRGNFRKGFWERFGVFSGEKKEILKSMQNPIWIHAVSVGETIAAVNFIGEWCKQDPTIRFVLSTTTSTGQQIARTYSSNRILPIYFPLDFYPCVQRALRVISPRLLIIFEVEVWPNLIVLAEREGIKLSLVNCRMSDKSLAGYLKFRWFFESIFNRFSMICTQSKIDATRIKSIVGSDSKIRVCNTMKFDQSFKNKSRNVSDLISLAFRKSSPQILAAASTHPGEELVIARILKKLFQEIPDLYTILIPRHVERTPDIENILTRESLNYVLLSDLREYQEKKEGRGPAVPVDEDTRILLINSTGEMMDFLAVSDIVFMGNSLAGNKGGHNIIEPAILGKPIIFGSGMENFRVVVEKFKENNACIQIDNESFFENEIRKLLNNPKELERLGRSSLKTVEKNRGAIKKTISLLQKL